MISGGVAPDDAPRRLEIEMVLVGGRTDTLATFRERARTGRAGRRGGRSAAGRALYRRMPEELKMAYDEQLAARVSDLMHQRPGVRESKMFGGVGWMINGNMACGVMRTTACWSGWRRTRSTRRCASRTCTSSGVPEPSR